MHRIQKNLMNGARPNRVLLLNHGRNGKNHVMPPRCLDRPPSLVANTNERPTGTTAASVSMIIKICRYPTVVYTYVRWLKNQLVLLPCPLPASWAWRLLRTGRTGPSCTGPPPPRRGFAMREPTAPPNAKDAPEVGEPRPRVEPCLAASRRSLTAVSCASNLCGPLTMVQPSGADSEVEGVRR